MDKKMKNEVKQNYRQYSPTSLTNAYTAVKDGMSVRGASRQYNVPMQTLRDRVVGKIDPECVTMGRSPIFSQEEEAQIVDQLKSVAQYGYGYTRSEVTDIATDFAVQLHIRTTDNLLTRSWMDGFLKRWPELKVLRPRSLEIARAKSASAVVVDKYFTELKEKIHKYKLEDAPHHIFNVDEKDVSPNHTPPSVVGINGYRLPGVTSGKSENTTIIDCGSAAGVAIPPYLVFAGKRWYDSLLDGASPGVTGTMSDSGWSNAHIFRDYLENHFLKYVPRNSAANPILLLLDGHTTHVSLGLIDWAKQHHIILFILPAHTSHILQPLDSLVTVHSRRCTIIHAIKE